MPSIGDAAICSANSGTRFMCLAALVHFLNVPTQLLHSNGGSYAVIQGGYPNCMINSLSAFTFLYLRHLVSVCFYDCLDPHLWCCNIEFIPWGWVPTFVGMLCFGIVALMIWPCID